MPPEKLRSKSKFPADTLFPFVVLVTGDSRAGEGEPNARKPFRVTAAAGDFLRIPAARATATLRIAL